jgi:hypothetical protein
MIIFRNTALSLFLLLTATGPLLADPAAALHPAYFRITVVDQATGRGIPAVKVETLNSAQYWADNNGIVAFNEPDLMNQKVWFTVESHGYLCESAPMGFKGIVLDLKPGGSAVVPMRRINVAQRLYRMTGSGMYRDSILLGDKVPPIPEPGKVPVLGQDGGDMVLFKGRYHWLWGDTLITRFPLGVFQGTSAISDLPGNGGLDPDKGVALHYLRKNDGELRPMINLKLEPGKPYWYHRMRVVKDEKGDEHFLTDYARVDGAMKVLERGLLEYSEKTGLLEFVAKYPDHPIFVTEGGGTTVFRHTVKGREYFYHSGPFPVVRYPADYPSQPDMTTREAFTCLKEGSRYDGSPAQIDRGGDGMLRWGWKKNTSPITQPQMDQFLKAGAMKDQERWYSIQDIDSGKPVVYHQGSVYWNPYRNCWISIFAQMMGETLVGEVWYAEADTPQGPWLYAKKIITHNWPGHVCSFYVPAQLQEFDKNGGQTVYLKGSFSADFGDLKTATPRHNYNIMVYKLELDDPRLVLPVPVYHDAAHSGAYGTKKDFAGGKRPLDLVWFAPDRRAAGTIPVYQNEDRNGVRLTTTAAAGTKPAFFALPAGDAAQSAAPTTELYEFTDARGKRIYSVDNSLHAEGFTRSPKPLCRVWTSTTTFNPFGDPKLDVW